MIREEILPFDYERIESEGILSVICYNVTFVQNFGDFPKGYKTKEIQIDFELGGIIEYSEDYEDILKEAFFTFKDTTNIDTPQNIML